MSITHLAAPVRWSDYHLVDFRRPVACSIVLTVGARAGRHPARWSLAGVGAYPEQVGLVFFDLAL
jgi:hypothetical protein